MQGAESGCHSEKERQIVLNCSRLLTRVLPYIFEDPDWRGFFWSTVPGAGRGGVCGPGRDFGGRGEVGQWGQGKKAVEPVAVLQTFSGVWEGLGEGGQLPLESWVSPPWGFLPLQLGRGGGRVAGPSHHSPHSLPGVLSRQLGVCGVGWTGPVILSRAEALEFRGLSRPLPVTGEAS